jgi:hypothetical protein
VKRVPLRIRALNIARREVGTHEVGFHNRGKRVDQYQRADSLPGVGYAWCMAFVQWCYREAGRPLPNLTASVGNFLSWARGVGWVVQKPARGDLVCFNFDADNWPDHVGFVLWRAPAFTVRTLEGNTSPGTAGSQADGGGVYPRWRSRRRCAFVRRPGY